MTEPAMKPEFRVSAEVPALIDAVATWIVEEALAAAHVRGQFTIALSGGSTPKALYRRLAEAPFAQKMPWHKTHILFGDERCVPPDNDESNFHMANAELLSRVPLPIGHVHRILGEKPPTTAAQEYAATLRSVLGPTVSLDVNLLGLGPDGHTASLFPGTAALAEREALTATVEVKQMKTPWRVTLTYPVLNAARNIAFLVTGAEKAAMVQRIVRKSGEPLPAMGIEPTGGKLIWFLDARAASQVVA
jgi:6-phosphogluconolactonase